MCIPPNEFPYPIIQHFNLTCRGTDSYHTREKVHNPNDLDCNHPITIRFFSTRCCRFARPWRFYIHALLRDHLLQGRPKTTQCVPPPYQFERHAANHSSESRKQTGSCRWVSSTQLHAVSPG